MSWAVSNYSLLQRRALVAPIPTAAAGDDVVMRVVLASLKVVPGAVDCLSEPQVCSPFFVADGFLLTVIRHVSARQAEEQVPHQQHRRQHLQQQLQLQREQYYQRQYYQHEQYQRQHQHHHHYQQQQQVQQADERYQRGAIGGGALPQGAIGRHPVGAPLRVPINGMSPDGGQR